MRARLQTTRDTVVSALAAVLLSFTQTRDAYGMRALELTAKAVVADPYSPCPVTGGVSFPRGALAADDGLRLRGQSGNELALQTRVLATWDPEGRQVKWLLVDFQLPGGAPAESRWRLEYGPDVPAAPGGPHVDTEASPWPPSRVLSGLAMTDQSGVVFRPGQADAVTETNGRLRTVLRVQSWYRDGAGNQLCPVILRLHYYAGLDRVRVFHSFSFDADPEDVQVRSLSLTLDGFGGKALVAGEQEGGQVVPADGTVAVFQDGDAHFAVTGSGQAEGRRSGTWLCAEGGGAPRTCFLRNGWEEFPKRISRQGHELRVELWPADGCPPIDLGRIADKVIMPDNEAQLRKQLLDSPGAISMYRFVTKGQTQWNLGSTVPLIKRARELETELFPDRPAFYYLLFGKNGQGSMKTHELVLERPAKIDADYLAARAKGVRHPPVLAVPPEWVCGSGVCGPQVPYGDTPLARLDHAWTYLEYSEHMAALDTYRLFGDRNWGDYINGNPAMAGAVSHVYADDPDFRVTDRIGWMNLESHDSAAGPWIQFFRTGDPRFFYLAEAQTEHVATVDHKHTFPDGAHRAAMFYHTVRHYDGGVAASHALTNAICLGYFATGDGMLHEVAVAAADEWVARQQADGTGWYAGRSPTRQNIAPATSVLNAYPLTWDRKYLDSFDRFLAVWGPVYDVRKHYLGGTLPFPATLFLGQVEHPALRKEFVRIMTDLRDRSTISNQAAYYLPAMAFLYEETGEPEWAAYCQFVLEWHQHRLEDAGGTDQVRRVVLGVPEFGYGFVSGYLASGLAAITRAREAGVDMEAAMQSLREKRTRLAGRDPETDDWLYYRATDFDRKTIIWRRPQ